MSGQASLLDDIEPLDDLRADIGRTPQLWTITYRDGTRELVRVVRICYRSETQALPSIEDVTEKVIRLCGLRAVAGRALFSAGGVAPHHQIALELQRALGRRKEVTEL